MYGFEEYLHFMTSSLVTLFTAFILTCLMAPSFIRKLHRMKFGQEVRDDGPQAHLKKQGTPTMGGIIFLIAIVISVALSFVLNGVNEKALLVLFLTAGFGLVGFLDDYLKIRKHQSEGLNPKQKLLLQIIITLIFALWVYGHDAAADRVFLPFVQMGQTAAGAEGLPGDAAGVGNLAFIRLPLPLFLVFVLFVVLGTDNGVNFTDGLDGLCSSVTCVVAGFFAIVGILSGSGISLVAAAVIGALFGFLLFNVYPAKVFMGDTGSLALGGFVAGAAVVSGLELFIPIVGFIYLIEVVSVIIQVTYFKRTHGKRFFKMAPIHHHFELLGNSETRIVAAFTIVTILLSLIALAGWL